MSVPGSVYVASAYASCSCGTSHSTRSSVVNVVVISFGAVKQSPTSTSNTETWSVSSRSNSEHPGSTSTTPAASTPRHTLMEVQPRSGVGAVHP